MVKIYKDRYSKKVVIEGVISDFPSLLNYSVSNQRVSIYSLEKKKFVFNDVWQNISDEDNIPFTDQIVAVNYLNTIFRTQDVEITENGGVDFLAHYILSKNN